MTAVFNHFGAGTFLSVVILAAVIEILLSVWLLLLVVDRDVDLFIACVLVRWLSLLHIHFFYFSVKNETSECLISEFKPQILNNYNS